MCRRWRIFQLPPFRLSGWVRFSTVTTFPHPCSSNRTCGFPASGFRTRSYPVPYARYPQGPELAGLLLRNQHLPHRFRFVGAVPQFPRQFPDPAFHPDRLDIGEGLPVHPGGPARPSRGAGWRVPRHRRGFPCCHHPHLPCVPSSLPRRNRNGAFVARFPTDDSLPRITGGSASTLPFSGPARRSLALWPAWSLNRPRRPFCQSASDNIVTSIIRSDCYRLERQLPGGVRTR